MPNKVEYKVLGQIEGTGGWDLLYTVPSGGGFTRTEAVCSTLTVCNSLGSNEKFSVAISKGGGAPSTTYQYLYLDVTIAQTDTFAATFGITLEQTDEVYVQSSSASGIAFQLFGSEIYTV
jgi:hypothetical protein